MSLSEVKLHKQVAPHLVQRLHFADDDFSTEGLPNNNSAHNGDGFQVAQFCRASLTDASSPEPLGRGGELVVENCDFRGNDNGPHFQQELNNLLGALAASLEELSLLRAKLVKNSTQDMLKLVLAVAEQVIHCEVKGDPLIIVGTLQKALQSAISSDIYHVKVHPDDLAIVMEHKPMFLASISGLKNITLEGDASVTPGGCLIESEIGQVDATIEGQLAELRKQLLPVETGE